MHVAAPGGHSQLAALDVFYRPGGLAAVSPLIDADTALSAGALRSTRRERDPGRGEFLVAEAGLGRGSVLVIVNAFGVNATVIGVAQAARERRVTTIGLSSRACEDAVPVGHPARGGDRALSRICDIHVDTKVPPGDAVPLGTDEALLAPMATTANAFALQAILLEATAMLQREGRAPDRWASSNLPGGDAHNAELASRYAGRVAAL